MVAELAAGVKHDYNFSEPIDLSVPVGIDPLLQQLIKTKAFQRLKDM